MSSTTESDYERGYRHACEATNDLLAVQDDEIGALQSNNAHKRAVIAQLVAALEGMICECGTGVVPWEIPGGCEGCERGKRALEAAAWPNEHQIAAGQRAAVGSVAAGS